MISVSKMKYLVAFVLCSLSVCEAGKLCAGLNCESDKFYCQRYDSSTKSFEYYCDNFRGPVPENCSKEKSSVDSLEVVHLKFGGCAQNTVADAIKTHINVISLDVSYSAYRTLNLLEFGGTQVEKLNASHNEISRVSLEKFRNMTEIDLSYNQLTSIDSIDGTTHLMRIHLSNNKIYQMDSIPFANLINVEYIDLSQNKIRELDFSKYKDLKNLQILHLENNLIGELNMKQFCGVHLLKGASVYVSWNKVSKMELSTYDDVCRDNFHIFANSEYNGFLPMADGKYGIHCKTQSFSKITSFIAREKTIDNVKELIQCFNSTILEINMRDNFVGKLNETVMKKLINVKKLYLESANLTDFDLNTLKNAKDLKFFDITENNVKRINNLELLTTFKKLSSFIAGENPFENSAQIIRALPTSIRTLELSNTNLDSDPNPLESLTRLDNLRFLTVSNNNLEKVNFTSLLKTLNQLEVFIAANCNINNAPEIIPNLNWDLNTLDLSGSYVGSVPAGTLKKYNNLYRLNLNNANIRHFNIDPLERLKQLELNGNELTELDDIKDYKFPELVYLEVSKNQLPCDQLNRLSNEFIKFSEFLDNFDQKHGEMCRPKEKARKWNK